MIGFKVKTGSQFIRVFWCNSMYYCQAGMIKLFINIMIKSSKILAILFTRLSLCKTMVPCSLLFREYDEIIRST